MAQVVYGKGVRVVGVERDNLRRDYVRRYNNGESIRDLATSSGRSYQTVHRLLTEGQVTFRTRGGPNNPGQRAAARADE